MFTLIYHARSPFRKPQKLSDRLLSKSERSPCRNPQKQCDRLYARVSAIALQKTSKIKRSPVMQE
ncbi:hypothetical protein [Nostoc sp. 'Peltigera membranacea cyanobiont' 213]|uniref:hypothetical protein n=1 Tax=Nostoc sp. 'Peltigera membranacea cyanobiont' 213 TaxID=2014530 RepID=UPI00117CFAC3|nr:hypothetical protein [Nostoc sp. 'Peltigera membranacea cyanobiont' 213]